MPNYIDIVVNETPNYINVVSGQPIYIDLVVGATGGGGSGTVQSVTGTTGEIIVDNTDPANPAVSIDQDYTDAINTAIDAKQDVLVNQTNIKSINGSSILGSGNLVVSGTVTAPATEIVVGNGTGIVSYANLKYEDSGKKMVLGGMTGSTWGFHTFAFDAGSNAVVYGTAGDFHLTSNAVGLGSWTYKADGTAANQYIYNGEWHFRNAVSGTAGAAIPWTEQFAITLTGTNTALKAYFGDIALPAFARIQIAAETSVAGTGQIKLNSVTLASAMTTPENGVVSNIDNDLYWTKGGVRQKLNEQSGSAILVVQKTANYTFSTASDEVVEATGSNSWDLTLPTMVGNTKRYSFVNNGTGVITLLTTAGQTVNGYPSGVIFFYPGDSASFLSNNTNAIMLD